MLRIIAPLMSGARAKRPIRTDLVEICQDPASAPSSDRAGPRILDSARPKVAPDSHLSESALALRQVGGVPGGKS